MVDGDTCSTAGRKKCRLSGGTHFLKCLGRKFFGEKLEILGFAWGGELTLDDTMSSSSSSSSSSS